MDSIVKDLYCSTSPTSVVVSEVDLFVDELLNLENDEQQQQHETQQQVSETQPIKQQQKQQQKQQHKDCIFLADNDVPFLNIPAEEADLEWLSQFVEETESLPFCTPFPLNYVQPNPKPVPVPEPKNVPTQPPALTRSWRRKRARHGASPKRCVSIPKQKCKHCGAVKTPLWRTGPSGSKTLCNACGVRYRSGRLYPEYRPAGSPCFSSDLHSNSHRKVLEIRQKKMPGCMGYGTGSELYRSLPGSG